MWNEVEFLETWHFANVVLALEQRFEKIEHIVQYPDGGGDLVTSTLSDILTTPEFHIMNPLELQVHLSQYEPLE